MTQKHKYQSYVAATQTVAKTKQIVMLYDGVIRFMRQAKEAIPEKRIEDRYKSLTKASEIITGMQTCLDFENGGDIAKVLYSFYTSIDSRIFSVHRTNSIATCDEVIDEIKKMRDVWNEIDQNSTTGGAASTTPSPETPGTANPEQNITLSA